jgi:hypothetical protein
MEAQVSAREFSGQIDQEITPTRFLFSLDGIVTTKLVVPYIGEQLGIRDELLRYSGQPFRGLVPFEESLAELQAIMRHFDEDAIQDALGKIPCHLRILEFIRQELPASFVVTEYPLTWVKRLAQGMGVKIFSSLDYVEGPCGLAHPGIAKKSELVPRFDCSTVVVGRSYIDAEMMRCADIGIAYGAVQFPSQPVMDVTDYAIFEELSLCRLLRRLS